VAKKSAKVSKSELYRAELAYKRRTPTFILPIWDQEVVMVVPIGVSI